MLTFFETFGDIFDLSSAHTCRVVSVKLKLKKFDPDFVPQLIQTTYICFNCMNLLQTEKDGDDDRTGLLISNQIHSSYGATGQSSPAPSFTGSTDFSGLTDHLALKVKFHLS